MNRRTAWLVKALGSLLLVAAVSVGALCAAAYSLLAPRPGEWAAQLQVGPLARPVSVPVLVRLASDARLAPWLVRAAPWLQPLIKFAYAGPLQLRWRASDQTLVVRCAPCSVRVPGWGSEALALDDLQVTLHRQGDQLNGEITSGRLQAQWQGTLQPDCLRLQLELPMTPIADAYGLFASALPELAHARIAGRFALEAALELPGGTFSITPQTEGFQVRGLGTEAFANARSGCSASAPPLGRNSWLARAVIAAEDQRFDTHTGYDLAELAAALTSDPAPVAHAGRGASTLTQQLAKLLVTGDARSPLRKLRELLYAVEMEHTLGKPRILQLYLALAPWGPGVCGAEAAARLYAGRHAAALSPLQSAWLAAMLHNPGAEAARWRETGQINLERTQWVLQGIRPLPRRLLARQLAALARLDWPAPLPQPAKIPLPD